MRLCALNILARPPLRGWPVLIALIGILFAGGSWAADPSTPAPSMTPRAKLDRLLACQEAEKATILKEMATVEAHIRKVEAFRATLGDPVKHRASLETAQEALAKDRGALAKAEERLRLADLQVRMTLQAMKYLPPPLTDSSPGMVEQGKRRIADWLAQYHSENSAVTDQKLEKENGFLNDPAAHARLNAVLDRLRAASPYETVPVTIRILDKPTGQDAFTTGTTVYFDRQYLDRIEQRYKDPKALEGQLMVTTSHELAHIQLHHVNLGFAEDTWQRFQNWMNLRDVEGSHAAYAAQGTLSNDAAFRSQLAEYQRDQEYQADLLGAQQALAAGVSPRSIKESFTRMWFDDLKRRLDPSKNGVEPHYDKMLEDHARPDERLKALEAALGEKFWEQDTLRMSGSCR